MDKAINPQNWGKSHHAEYFEKLTHLLWCLVKKSLIMKGPSIKIQHFFEILKFAKNIENIKEKQYMKE